MNQVRGEQRPLWVKAHVANLVESHHGSMSRPNQLHSYPPTRTVVHTSHLPHYIKENHSLPWTLSGSTIAIPVMLYGTLLLLSSTAAPALPPEQIYTVTGKIQRKVHHRGFHAWKATFTVAVSNAAWAITIVGPPDGEDQRAPMTAVWKQVFDGELLTSAVHFPSSMVPRNPGPNELGNDSTLEIELEDMPNCLTGGMGQLWLAYASSFKLAVSTNRELEPLWFTDPIIRKKRYMTPASWKLDDDLPHLPDQAEFYFDPTSFYAAAGQIERYSKITNSVIWSYYKVIKFHSVDGLRLPKEFRYEHYWTSKQSAANRPLALYEYRGELVSAHRGIASDALAHGFGKKTLVQDERWNETSPTAEPLQYVTTNQQIRPLTDPTLKWTPKFRP